MKTWKSINTKKETENLKFWDEENIKMHSLDKRFTKPYQ